MGGGKKRELSLQPGTQQSCAVACATGIDVIISIYLEICKQALVGGR